MLILLTWHWPFLGNYRQASIVRLTLLGISKIGLLSPEDPWPKADTRLAQVFKWWWRSLKWWAIQDRNFYGNTLSCILIMYLPFAGDLYMTMRGSIHLDEFGRSLHQSLPPPQWLGPTSIHKLRNSHQLTSQLAKLGRFPPQHAEWWSWWEWSENHHKSPRVFPVCWTLNPSYSGSGHVIYNLGGVLPKSKIISIGFTQQ